MYITKNQASKGGWGMKIGDKKLKNIFYRILTHIFFDKKRKTLKLDSRYYKSRIKSIKLATEINIKMQEIIEEQRNLEIERINNLKSSEEVLKYIAIQKVNEKYKI